jgi:hypothetical protein
VRSTVNAQLFTFLNCVPDSLDKLINHEQVYLKNLQKSPYTAGNNLNYHSCSNSNHTRQKCSLGHPTST